MQVVRRGRKAGNFPTVAPLLDQLLLPQRLAARVIEDSRRMADAAVSVGALARDLRAEVRPLKRWMDEAADTVASLRDQVSGVRAAVQPMSRDLDALRAAFAGTNAELERLREQFVPELGRVRDAAGGLHEEVKRQRELIDALNAQIKEMLAGGLATLNETIKPLVKDADEVREVVEPLQSATERVGRVAERLPGPGRKRSSDSGS